ncbi:MAG TPA: hypothetical protein VJ973_03135 [Christiangramia sp.]|nr:hypothetical protein [Christiangramia sp.]
MINKLILLLMLTLSIQVFSQKTISRQRIVKQVTTFNPDEVYNKNTGEKIPKEEVVRMIQMDSKTYFDAVYDNSGNIVKHLYDPNNLVSSRLNSTLYKTPEKNEIFPNLILTTVDGEVMEIKDLRGKMVILRMDMNAGSFNHQIKKLDKAINETGRKSEIESIIIFHSSKDEIESGFDLKTSNFKLIPNGINFQNMLNIRVIPTTFVLDKEGKVLDVSSSSHRMNFLKLLNES